MSGEFYRSLGLEVSGSKNDRTALAVLDFYPKTQRLILVDIQPKIVGVEDMSADEALVRAVEEALGEAPHLTGLSIHGPLSLPPVLRQAVKEGKPQPFSEKSRDAEILWMNELWKRLKPKPRPFAPYLERPAELHMRYVCKEKFPVAEAMGANLAPIAARLQFLKPHLPEPQNEVYPRATLARVVASLGLPKTIARDYSDLERGVYTREQFFTYLGKKIPQLFIYEKDLEQMVVNLSAFNAFLCALTQHLIFAEQCETPSKNFPKSAGWIHFPRSAIDWNRVFSPS